MDSLRLFIVNRYNDIGYIWLINIINDYIWLISE